MVRSWKGDVLVVCKTGETGLVVRQCWGSVDNLGKVRSSEVNLQCKMYGVVPGPRRQYDGFPQNLKREYRVQG